MMHRGTPRRPSAPCPPSRWRRHAAAIVLVGLVAACSADNEPPSASPRPTVGWTAGASTSPEVERDYTGAEVDEAMLADMAGLPNPDPEHVSVEVGAEVVAVVPRNDAADHVNLQWAVDNVAVGGTVRLDSGVFFLGDGHTEPKHTVSIRRGVTLVGERAGDEWSTVVRGGGALGSFSALGAQLESGPFRVVNETDGRPVVIEDLWIQYWTAEAVYVEAARGFVFRRNRLSDAVNSTAGGTLFVHALFTSGELALGAFVVEDNLVELGSYEGVEPHDEQLLGVFYSNHDLVRVAGNRITTMDEAIEIIGNGISPQGDPYPYAGAPRRIVVEDNVVETALTVGDAWPGRFSVLIANNQGVETVQVRGNSLTVSGFGYAFGLSGERLEVTGNTISFEELDGAFPPGAVVVGFPPFGFEMGAALTDSTFTDNTFAGSLTGTALGFRHGGPSTANTFELGDSLASLGAETTLSIAADMAGNTFAGDLEPLVDHAPPGANTLG